MVGGAPARCAPEDSERSYEAFLDPHFPAQACDVVMLQVLQNRHRSTRFAVNSELHVMSFEAYTPEQFSFLFQRLTLLFIEFRNLLFVQA